MAAEIKQMELTPDRGLIDSDFEGYKLSLEAIAKSVSDPLESNPIRQSSPNEDQYSYHHAKLFSDSCNLLVSKKSNGKEREIVYVVRPDLGQIFRINQQESSLQSTAKLRLDRVWSFPDFNTFGPYPVTLVPVENTEYFLVSDGKGVLHICKESLTASPWTSTFCGEICGVERPFVLHSALHLNGDLHILIRYVEEKSSVENFDPEKYPASFLNKNANFVNVVEWFTFKIDKDEEKDTKNKCIWNLERVKRFVFPGSLDYLSLSPDGLDLLASTDKPFQVVFDSSGGLLGKDEETKNSNDDSDAKNSREPLPPYYWMQGVEDIALWFNLPDDFSNKKEIKVVLRPREIKVTFRGEVKLEGRLWNILDTDSMTWTISDNHGRTKRLEISACKANNGMIWQKFTEDPTLDGEEIGDPAAMEEIEKARGANEKVIKLPAEDPSSLFNSQQLEDCDMNQGDEFSLYVFKDSTNAICSKKNLMGHQWLFNQRNGDGTDSMCLRHDVDGFVWKPEIEGTQIAGEENSESSSRKLRMRHCATFSAFGYVQASKESKKFVVAPFPAANYAALVDRTRHVYIYLQPQALDEGMEVRNRKTGKRVAAVAKQKVITLEDNDEILGAAATDEKLFILTNRLIFCYTI